MSATKMSAEQAISLLQARERAPSSREYREAVQVLAALVEALGSLEAVGPGEKFFDPDSYEWQIRVSNVLAGVSS